MNPEAAYGLETEVLLGRRPAQCQVEYATAPDRRQLVTVADQPDLGAALVDDGEERASGVLVEHAGFVDEEYVAGPERLGSSGLVAASVAVVIS